MSMRYVSPPTGQDSNEQRSDTETTSFFCSRLPGQVSPSLNHICTIPSALLDSPPLLTVLQGETLRLHPASACAFVFSMQLRTSTS